MSLVFPIHPPYAGVCWPDSNIMFPLLQSLDLIVFSIRYPSLRRCITKPWMYACEHNVRVL